MKSRLLWITLLLSGLLIAGQTSALAQADPDLPPNLFDAPPVGFAADEAAPPPADYAVRQRYVSVNAAALAGSQMTDAPDAITLNLFDDTTLVADRTGVQPRTGNAAGYIWTGSVRDANGLGDVVLIFNGAQVSGTVSLPGVVYDVSFVNGGLHLVGQFDQAGFPPYGADTVPAPINPQATGGLDIPRAADGSMDSGRVVEVMVVYTPAARNRAGGTQQIQANIEQQIALGNIGRKDSGIDPILRLVLVEEVAYTEQFANNNLFGVLDELRFTGGSNSAMDTVQTRRNDVAADVIHLVVYTDTNPNTSPGTCGLALFPTAPNQFFSGSAYSVSSYDCLNGLTLQHEIGHNFGADHNIERRSSSNNISGSAFGYQSPGNFATTMAYGCSGSPCPRVNRWSNPNATYFGLPTGTSNADNATTLNNWADEVANYRQSLTDLPYDVNHDDVVDTLDVTFLINNLGATVPSGNVTKDINGDNRITPADAVIVLNSLNN